ncbi:MAG: hypothetical protein H6713_27455 [Myxococcales bacterium]|nr:hypothetical protein [Myxococcales bacterium]MCB9753696.1 hypothetical protein [Myxococcales bacterium]
MFVAALFDPLSVVVLCLIVAMIGAAALWLRGGQNHFHALVGGLSVLRRVGAQLHHEHPIRKRLEAAPVVDLSFEEIARLMVGDRVEPAARALILLRERVGWIERFAQYAIHLGILGTVFALVSSDPTDLEGFRARLPIALGTTFWGLIGALVLSALAGACESLLERASTYVREALLEGLEREPAPAPDVSVDAPTEEG